MAIELSPTKCVKQKLPYQTPRLVCYGSLRDLTQAGTAGGTESSGQGPGCLDPKPLKRLGTACGSDRRIKEDIVLVGSHQPELGLYLFYYKPEFRDEWGHGRQFGVMADEVEGIMPEAVCVHPDGYKMVDYDKLGITRFVN